MILKNIIVALCAGLFVNAALAGPSTNPQVARVLGKPVYADSIGLKFDAQNHPQLPASATGAHGNRNPIDGLILASIAIVQDAWLTAHNLHATVKELREYQSFVKRSATKQISGERATMAELGKTLKNKNLNNDQRAEIGRQRESLRITVDEESNRLTNEMKWSENQMRDVYGKAIDQWKFYKQIFKLYGGGITELRGVGPFPVGAIARIMKEYSDRGQIQVFDADLKAAFWQRLEKIPPDAVWLRKVDWTPFWKK